MVNNLLLIAATKREIECIRNLHTGEMNAGIHKITGGIGPVSTVYSLMDHLMHNERPGVVLNIGIAGSYRNEFPVGTVVTPATDCFADLGVYDDNKFISLSQAGINDNNDNYTPAGIFSADADFLERIPAGIKPVKAVTVNTATGSNKGRNKIEEQFHPDIETMEGAAIYYVCKQKHIPCIGLRSVSNIVGRRDKSLWDIDLALRKLGQAVEEYLNELFI
ncbi:MAG TPA: futalosine hydrolase [Bacteroidales bacterium]|nr:futalosine hydrolase [Bacteroidales bacterium]